MNAVHINFLEEFKYVDKVCREMYNAPNGVSAYIEQMDSAPMAVRYRIAGWDDDYRRLKHIRWLRNQIAHNTEYVECTQADLDWLKTFHNRLLTQQDPLAMAYRVTREAQQNKPQKFKETIPNIV